jgi:hypothetical protein
MTSKNKNTANQIYLSISQIAIITGYSPYGSLIEMILNLWSKVDKTSYNKKLLDLENKFSKSFKSVSEWDKLSLISQELGLKDLKYKISNVMKNNSQNNLLLDQESLINQIKESTNKEMSKDQLESKKQILCKLVNSFTNRGFGSHNEKSAISIYKQITNSDIIEQQNIVLARLQKPSDKNLNTEWFIKGKIDGVAVKNNQKILIEIKNRTKSLFGELKDYEKPQIQMYLKLMELEKGHMVEHLKQDDSNEKLSLSSSSENTNTNINTNIIDVSYDPEYCNTIIERLKKFIKFFYKFIENDELIDLVLLNGSDDEDTEKYLRNKLNENF